MCVSRLVQVSNSRSRDRAWRESYFLRASRPLRRGSATFLGGVDLCEFPWSLVRTMRRPGHPTCARLVRPTDRNSAAVDAFDRLVSMSHGSGRAEQLCRWLTNFRKREPARSRRDHSLHSVGRALALPRRKQRSSGPTRVTSRPWRCVWGSPESTVESADEEPG